MTTVQERPVATQQQIDPTTELDDFPTADRALPARAAGALLPDERLGARGRGPGPGDVPARLEGVGQLPGPLLGPHLALPDRHQRLPHQPRGPAAAAAARRARHPRPDGRRRPRAGPRDRLARAGARRRGRGRRARLDPARLRRRPPAPAGPAARRADPARRAALVGRRGRRGARHHRRRGQLRPPARARPDGRPRPHRGHRRRRTSTTGSGSCSTSTSTRSGARTSTRSSGCSRPRRPGRCRRSPAGTSAPRTSAG